ncbi:hypothetical protein GA0115256_111365 [Streptomyces sp. DconLS]|nr:hypothetical protein GA0115256_111365 [Streptomyces sp. DconLS]SCF75716.1 hypothetical protein GA0115258_111632 [Streptomyces sp. LamerLS-31b]
MQLRTGTSLFRPLSPDVPTTATATGAPHTPASPAAAGPPGAGRGVEGGRPQPAHRTPAAPVAGRRGDVRTGPEAAQIKGARVVPAHAVQQPGQLGRGARGHEEMGPALGGHGHRTQRQAHPLQPDQGLPAGRLGDLHDVEGAAHRQQHRGTRALRPRLGHIVQRGPGRHLGREVERMRARLRTVLEPAGAGARRGPRARHHVPAPQPGELGDGGALRGPATPTRAGADLANAADREAHAPSNGSSAPVVTTRNETEAERNATAPTALVVTEPGRRFEACRVARRDLRAPLCITPLASVRPVSSESRATEREFIRRGGEWWRFSDPRGRVGDHGVTVSVRNPRGTCTLGYAGGNPTVTRR